MSDKTHDKMEKVLERLESLPLSDMLVQFNNFNQKEMSRMSSEIRHLENIRQRNCDRIRILKSMLIETGMSENAVEFSLGSRMDALKDDREAEWEESRW